MSETVTIQGKSFTLKGELLKEGKKLPDCVLTGEDLQDVNLADLAKDKALLVMTVPSLDTPTCSKQTHRFNQELGRFGKNLQAVAISMDLPFAQKRWCADEDVDNILVLSDYKHREFGHKFGVLIPDLGLLTRAVFIFDASGTARHVHLVKEVSDEPPYDEILDVLSMRVG